MGPLHFSTLLLIACSLLVPSICLTGEEKYLPCRLVWKYIGIGDPVPSKAVEAHKGRQYPARLKDIDGAYGVGSYSVLDGKAYFPFENPDVNTTGSSHSAFEILTNPHDCVLSWPQHSDGSIPSQFGVLVAEGLSGPYIGRGYEESGVESEDVWISGEVYPDSQGITIVVNDNTTILSEYQVLTSYSKGFRLEATDFVMENDPFEGEMGYLGLDNIMNDAEVEISKVTKHYRKMVETSSVTTKKETTSSKTESSGFDAYFVGSSKKIEHTYKESVEEKITTIKETEIILEKELIIPPKTGITACSTVVIIDNFSSDFTARGVYKAPGMTASEILEVLKLEGIKGPTIVVGETGEEEVVVNIEGTFEGSLSLDSQFVAVPFGQSCMGTQKNLFRQKMERFRQKYAI